MKKPVVGLALGGGGAKGWAHIGIIKSLLQNGIVPDVVCGTSIGSVVGGAYAGGQLDLLEDWVRRLSWSQVVSLMDFRFSGGLIEGDRLFTKLGQDLKVADLHIEDLGTPFGAVATNLDRGTEVWLREGSVLEAVRASVALPGLLSPAKVGDHWLVDGGLVNPVPVSLCRALGADFVIAVDLNSNRLVDQVKVTSEKEETESDDDTGFLLSREAVRDKFYDTLLGMVDRFRVSEAASQAVPSIVDVAVQSINIMSIRITRSRLAGDPPDILMRPQLGHIGLMEFHRAEEAIEAGIREARYQEQAIRALQQAME